MSLNNNEVNPNEDVIEVNADDLDREMIMHDAEVLADVSSALETMEASEPTLLESAKHDVMEKIAGIMHQSLPLYELIKQDVDAILDKIEKDEATPAELEEFAARLNPEDRKPFIHLADVIRKKIESSDLV